MSKFKFNKPSVADFGKILLDYKFVKFYVYVVKMRFCFEFYSGETHVHTVSQFLKCHADSTTNSSKKLLYLLIDLIIKLRGVSRKYFDFALIFFKYYITSLF